MFVEYRKELKVLYDNIVLLVSASSYMYMYIHVHVHVSLM